jgi:hypothetical protein
VFLRDSVRTLCDHVIRAGVRELLEAALLSAVCSAWASSGTLTSAILMASVVALATEGPSGACVQTHSGAGN